MLPSTEPVEPIWERLPNEPDEWFDRFDRYARPLGAEYTLPRAFRLWAREHQFEQGTAMVQMWHSAAAEWNWAQRASAWSEQDRHEQKKKWDARRDEIREEDFAAATTLRRLVAAALTQAPDFIQTRREEVMVEGKKQIVVIKELKLADVIKALEAANKVARLSAEMNTEKSALDVNANVKAAMVKGYVGISPDDWDSDSSAVQPPAVAGDAVAGQAPNPSPNG